MSIIALILAATVSVGSAELPTYPYSDPDPMPHPEKDFWPYARWDGQSATPITQSWKRVTLESDRLRVTILPEIGGKIWGAVDKITGEEFIYENDAVKFRDIAMCGPWTSGGIEFNFGIIGHHPMTAREVRWTIRTNEDGSVSYFCGDHERICDTIWQVEVRLRDGEDFFTTRTQWFNASPVEEPYYQWMTAAYSARNDPEFHFPGSRWISHEGRDSAWPRDEEGHNLSKYSENAFGGAKSYHIVNGDERYYAVWWPSKRMGSYHENEYGEKYGRKIFLWALSRAGGIWEDLLTDAHGQYVELQSGRVFNQPVWAAYQTPFRHPTFTPGRTDVFEERWGVVRDRAEMSARERSETAVTRPTRMPEGFYWKSAYGRYLEAEQRLRAARDVRKAKPLIDQSLAKDPHFAPALELAAEIAWRRGEFSEVRDYAARALALNAYSAKANYLDALAVEALSQGADTALERLGIAAYAQEYRCAACVRMAKIERGRGRVSEASRLLARARLANPLSVTVLRLERALAEDNGDAAAVARCDAEFKLVWPTVSPYEEAPKPVADGWRGDFDRAVRLIHVGRDAEADHLLEACGDVEDAVFRQFRATRRTGSGKWADLMAARRLGDGWRIGRDIANAHLATNGLDAARAVLADYVKRFPRQNTLEILYADTLQKLGLNRECVEFLKSVLILPSEGSSGANHIWQRAWHDLGDDKMAGSYPENLGQGRPFGK